MVALNGKEMLESGEMLATKKTNNTEFDRLFAMFYPSDFGTGSVPCLNVGDLVDVKCGEKIFRMKISYIDSDKMMLEDV